MLGSDFLVVLSRFGLIIYIVRAFSVLHDRFCFSHRQAIIAEMNSIAEQKQ